MAVTSACQWSLTTWLRYLRLSRHRRKRFIVSVCVLMSITTITLHHIILPSLMGYYNAPCYLSPQQDRSLRHILRHVIRLYEQSNSTYWLDYGTLLGAYRDGDIIPYDGDGDVSRLISSNMPEEYEFGAWFKERLGEVGIEGNTMLARHGDMQVDLVRWHLIGEDGEIMKYQPSQELEPQGRKLKKYYPKWAKGSAVNRLGEMAGLDEMRSGLILPTRPFPFLNVTTRIPHEVEELLEMRYLKTWRVRLAYKWKCWFPR